MFKKSHNVFQERTSTSAGALTVRPSLSGTKTMWWPSLTPRHIAPRQRSSSSSRWTRYPGTTTTTCSSSRTATAASIFWGRNQTERNGHQAILQNFSATSTHSHEKLSELSLSYHPAGCRVKPLSTEGVMLDTCTFWCRKQISVVFQIHTTGRNQDW